MGKSGGEYKRLARKALHGNWILSMAFFVCMFFVMLGSILSVIGIFVCVGALSAGLALFYTNMARGKRATIGDMFTPFSRIGANFGAWFLQGFYLFWWSFLPIVPIVKCFSYALTYYILNDNPTMSANDAITASRKMMVGHKATLFWLHMGFWALGILTIGIGLIWLVPYYQATVATLYNDLNPQVAPRVAAQMQPQTQTSQPRQTQPQTQVPQTQVAKPPVKLAPIPPSPPRQSLETPMLEDNIYTTNDDL